jgi:hypothetical protein
MQWCAGSPHKSTTNEALQWSGVTFSSMVTKNYNLLIKCPREYNPRTTDKKKSPKHINILVSFEDLIVTNPTMNIDIDFDQGFESYNITNPGESTLFIAWLHA